jgi:hypothetical protein
MRTRYFIGAFAIAGAAAALIIAPTAGADPESNLPDCTTTGDGGGYTGTQTTECSTPGNVQINATAPEPVYPYPWDDEFYGSSLIIGGGDYGPHGGGGGGGGHR